MFPSERQNLEVVIEVVTVRPTLTPSVNLEYHPKKKIIKIVSKIGIINQWVLNLFHPYPFRNNLIWKILTPVQLYNYYSRIINFNRHAASCQNLPHKFIRSSGSFSPSFSSIVNFSKVSLLVKFLILSRLVVYGLKYQINFRLRG